MTRPTKELVEEVREDVRNGYARTVDVIAICVAYLALEAEIERLKKRIKQVMREAEDDAKASATERGWQERQGEDYGSY